MQITIEVYQYICENCHQEFEIKTNKDFEIYSNLGIDIDDLEDWENGFGAPVGAKCLKKLLTINN